MMRWEHLWRTQPMYLSPAQWVQRCAEFAGTSWKAKCAEYPSRALDAERAAARLLDRFQLHDQVSRVGAVSIHLPVGYQERETHDEFTVVWMDLYGKLTAGFRSEETDKCMDDYACTVRILFDRNALRINGVEILKHQ